MTSFFNAHGTNPNIFGGCFQDLTFGSAPTDMLAGRSWVSIDELIDTPDEPTFDLEDLDIDIDMLDTLWSSPFLGSDYDDPYCDTPELPGIAVSLLGEVFFHEDYPLFGSYAELETVAPVPPYDHLDDADFFFELESERHLDDWLNAEMHDVDGDSAEEEDIAHLSDANHQEVEQEEMQFMPSFSGTMVEHKRRKNHKLDIERSRNHTMPRESIRVIPIWMTSGYTAERFLRDHATFH